MSFIENNKLLPSYQSAYRKGYSTETALVKLMNDMLHNMEHQGVTALVCIDLSAAFDTFHHEVLLEVLKHNSGVGDTAIAWFDSYLRSRSVKILIGEET